MSRSTIKIMALCTMTCSHIAYLFLIPGSAFYELLVTAGCFTAPCMCFFLAEGYDRTSDRDRYFLRMFLWACLTQPVYFLAFGDRLNMLFTLCACLLLLQAHMEIKNRMLKAAVCTGLILSTIWMDWPVAAPLFVLFFYYGTGFAPFLACCAVCMMVSAAAAGDFKTSLLQGLTVLFAGSVLTFCYNRKKGHTPNWFFYLFYPTHLLVLLLIKSAL